MGGATVGEILTRVGLIDALQLRSAIARQEQWGGRLVNHLLDLGFVNDDAVAEALAKALGLRRVRLDSLPRDGDALTKVEQEMAEQKGIFPCSVENGSLWLAMSDPTDLETMNAVTKRSGCRIRTAVAGEREIQIAIWRHYKNQEPPASLLVKTAPTKSPNNDAQNSSARGGPGAEIIQKMQQELEKNNRVLRGLIQVLADKQILTNEEIRAAITRLTR